MNTLEPAATNDRCRVAQSGFTLIEMVITVVLLAMITGAITAAFVSSLNATSATKQRVLASNDAQLISGFLTRDAQAAGGTNPVTGVADPTLGVTTPAGAFTNGCTAPGTPIVGFKWIDLSSNTTREANYSYVTTATGTYKPQQLLRTTCTTTTTPPATTTGTSVLANNAVTTATATAATPVAWCDGNQTPPTCPTSFPKTVSMAVTVNTTAQNVTTPYSFTLTASLRSQSNSQPDIAATAASAPLVLLGGSHGACVSALASMKGQGTTNLLVAGAETVSGCPALFTGSAKSHASGGTFVAPPGTCVTGIQATCTATGNTGFYFADPFAAEVAANTLTPPSTQGCNGGRNPRVNNNQYTAGTYPSAVTVQTVRGISPTFTQGVYVFCKGVSVTVSTTANGVLFYIPAGFTITDSAALSMTPYSTTGPSANLTIWKDGAPPASGQTEVSLSGSPVRIAGTVYAPLAVVGGKGIVNVQQIVAEALDMSSGNNELCIGPVLTVTGPATLPNGTVGQTYAPTTAAATGGCAGPPYTWSDGNTLPAGLTIDKITGAITGKPTTAGTFTVTITVTDPQGITATMSYTVTINPALVITGTLPPGIVGQAYPPNPLTATGGTGGYTWTAVGLPAGLSMATNGTISGPPNTAGTFNPTITVTDSFGDTVSKTFNNVVIFKTPAITNVQLLNKAGGTAGRIEQGDQIVVTFSSPMKATSFCSTWSGAPALVGPDISVKVTSGGVFGTDKVTVSTSASCASFNFGSIDLKDNGYVLLTSSFGNAVGNTSIAWNGSNVLTITLGAQASGLVLTNNANNQPIYTASGLMMDTAGETLTNSPFTFLASGKQF